MKKAIYEGEQLRAYLKEHRINQDAFAKSLNMTRQGLNFHMVKERLSADFKIVLAERGIRIFDMQPDVSAKLVEAYKRIDILEKMIADKDRIISLLSQVQSGKKSGKKQAKNGHLSKT